MLHPWPPQPVFNFFEEQWSKPCIANMPWYFHGLCMYGPMFFIAACLLSFVAIMAWLEERGKKAKALAEGEKKTTTEPRSKKKD